MCCVAGSISKKIYCVCVYSGVFWMMIILFLLAFGDLLQHMNTMNDIVELLIKNYIHIK